MAEAKVDGMPSKFFCHQCKREIDFPLLPDYECPFCSSGFIEELMNDVNSGESSMVGSEDLEFSDLESFSSLDVDDVLDTDATPVPGDNLRDIRDRLANSRRDNYRRRRNLRREAEQRRTLSSLLNRDDRSLQQTFNTIIQELIVSLPGVTLPHLQGSQPFIIRLMENSDDYYMGGREGLDAIVTELLNQMDGTGPPPLPKKQIEEIPTVLVAESHIEVKLQCSVCWEDFILSESVKQLPCQHLYHIPCIVPWLELHGTCPICRQSLSDQNSDAGNDPPPQDAINLATIFRNFI